MLNEMNGVDIYLGGVGKRMDFPGGGGSKNSSGNTLPLYL